MAQLGQLQLKVCILLRLAWLGDSYRNDPSDKKHKEIQGEKNRQTGRFRDLLHRRPNPVGNEVADDNEYEIDRNELHRCLQGGRARRAKAEGGALRAWLCEVLAAAARSQRRAPSEQRPRLSGTHARQSKAKPDRSAANRQPVTRA